MESIRMYWFYLTYALFYKQLSYSCYQITITPNSDLDDGGDLASSHIYINNSSLRFNETDHLLRSMNWNPKNIITLQKMSLEWNKRIEDISRLWTPKLSDEINLSKYSTDCTFDWVHDGWDRSFNFIIYFFTIHQHSCHTANVTLQGGSTFDIFAYNSLSTVSCSYTDTRNNRYQVQCRMPCITHKCIEEQRLHTQHHDCIQLTALLSHEHYDSFGEISFTIEGLALHIILQDNQTYCMTPTTRLTVKSLSIPMSKSLKHQLHNNNNNNNQHHQHQWNWSMSTVPYWHKLLPHGVRMYSGIWVTDDMLKLLKHRKITTSLYVLKKSENLTAMDVHAKENLIVNHSTYISAPRISKIPPDVLSDRASHMRYNFDGVIEILFGSGVFRNIRRKHVDLIIENSFQFNWNAHISDIYIYMQKFCQANGNGNGNSRVVFIQSGHWDLRTKGLRYIIRNYTDSPGYKLLQLFNDIFTGTIPCPGVRHIVWMTTVPHPLCSIYKDKDTDHISCDSTRGQRYNANIRALNEFFLRGILSSYNNATTSSSYNATTNTYMILKKNVIQLSVIDAYSIIYPRIIYDENNELVCTDHYSCRYEKYGTIHTPGGAAVLQSILNVMLQDTYKKPEDL
eukprot:gene8772-18143_t